MFPTLQSLFGEMQLHESSLGTADEDDEDGKSHRHVVANLRPTRNAECDGRIRGRESLSDVRVASAPSRDDDDDDDALGHLIGWSEAVWPVISCVWKWLLVDCGST